MTPPSQLYVAHHDAHGRITDSYIGLIISFRILAVTQVLAGLATQPTLIKGLTISTHVAKVFP